jgi:hypothetical protein
MLKAISANTTSSTAMSRRPRAGSANFYGGALIKASDRQAIELELKAAAEGIIGEAKWTKIGEETEDAYIAFAAKFLEMVKAGRIKVRVMFTQNIHSIDHIDYEEKEAKYFKLYYQFIKHAFGLMFCNEDRQKIVHVTVLLDDAPDTVAALNNFKNYLASLSTLPDFFGRALLSIGMRLPLWIRRITSYCRLSMSFSGPSSSD